jgi:hypothetical protein
LASEQIAGCVFFASVDAPYYKSLNGTRKYHGLGLWKDNIDAFDDIRGAKSRIALVIRRKNILI